MTKKATDEKKVDGFLTIENAKLIFCNFTGRVTKYNQNGFRTFNVLLEEPVGKELERDGWNVKWLKPLEEGDPPQAHIEVKLQYGRVPPKIVMVSGGNMTHLSEEMVGSLDFAEIDHADLVIRPYNWEVNGASGVKAYLKTLYVVLVEDPFERRYGTRQEVPL